MEISHPWHDHPLFLSDEAEFEHKCFICLQRFDGNPFYACACVDCKYYVHKSCAQLPVQIQHHFHQPHPLALCFGNDFFCDSCHKRFRNELRFSCSVCVFDLDVNCALMSDIDTEGKEFITHFTHQHPLTICSKDGDNPLNCFACKKTSSDLIYGCTPCDYFLHKSCAQISTHVLHASHRRHALSLVVNSGFCRICGHSDYNWKLYCSICDLLWDASCLIESAKDAKNSKRSCFLCGKQHLDSDSCVDLLYLINQSCIQLPEEIKHEFHSHKLLLLLGTKSFTCDSCHKWFDRQSHYHCEECNFQLDVKCALMPSIQYEESDESFWPVIPYHFKHQHPLQLISEVDDINCSACHTIKSSPTYGCIKCEYFLHQCCLELPIQIEHPLNDSHVLTIQPFHKKLIFKICYICSKNYDGFAYGCSQCRVYIGIECILKLGLTEVHKYHPIVEYKYHRHRLCFIEKSFSDQCKADNTFCHLLQESSEFEFTKSYTLRCNKCDYNLHFLCGPLPCTIKHKCHLLALKLVDFIVEDDSDEYYCDICEEIRNPRLCIYYCEYCSFFAHVHCVISESRNVFKKNPGKDELMIAGDLTIEYTKNPIKSLPYASIFRYILEKLDAKDMSKLSLYFPHGKLFPREEDQQVTREQNSSSTDIIDEPFFYNDDIDLNIEEILKDFKPCTEYHIQPEEFEWKVYEVKGHYITSNFAPHFRFLVEKYGDFVQNSKLSKNAKSVLLYFLGRVLRSMCRTFVVDVTEKQLFTWLYYLKGITEGGFDLQFLKPTLDCIKKSYFGLRAMKFENEAPDLLERNIVILEQKISDIKTQIEELKRLRQQHRVGKIAEESKVMREEYFTEAKKLKWQIPGKSIF